MILVAIAPTAYGTPDAAPSDGLQEIVVTATKRTENSQQVPLPITTLSGKELAQLGVRNAFDLAAYRGGVPCSVHVPSGARRIYPVLNPCWAVRPGLPVTIWAPRDLVMPGATC
jgi:hypothetical protein